MSEGLGVVAGVTEVVVVEGPDAESFLQGLLSQDVTLLEPARARRSFLLGPQGKLRALLWLTREGDRFQIFTDTGLGARVVTDLSYFKIRVKAAIAEPVEAYQVVGEAVGAAAPLGAVARFLTASPPAGLPFLPAELWEARRIEGGEPVMDRDVDEKTIPQETGLSDEAVSFTKGCFLGQELVARLDSRGGRVNRHLRGLRLESGAPPKSPVTSDGSEVGVVTSVAWSERVGSHIGLALLSRRVGPGDSVTVAGHQALVVDLPFPIL